MKKHNLPAGKALAVASSLVCLAGAASAQGLMATSGVIVATNDDPVPDATGTPIPGFTFGGSGALSDNVVLDESGNIFFRGRFQDSGGSLNPWDDRAFFYGSSRATLRMVVRGGDQAPGLASGVLLRTTTGSSSSLGGSPRLGPDGRTFWGSTIYDGGVNITSANDSAIFGGFLGSQTVLVQKGDVAAGTGGATFAQAFNSPSQQTTAINRNGHIAFQGTLVNGTGVPPVTTTSGMNNQAGIWAGLPGALELVARKSDPVSGLGGAVAIDTSATIGFIVQTNTSNKVFYEVVLSTTQGAPAANVANDRAYMVHTPGAGSVKLVREGDDAPGTFDPFSSTFATFNAISGDSWSIGTGAASFLRDDTVIFQTELRGGDVVANVNDRALYRGTTAGLTMVARKGQPAPGTDAVWSVWNNVSVMHNASGQICFQGTVSGGTSTATDDSGVWAGFPGSLSLVLREGAVVPGTGGSIAGNLSGTAIYFNDLGQVLFNVSLSGGTITGTALFAWDPVLGLMPVVLPGDQIEVAPAVFKTASGFGGVQFNNTDGAALHFGHNGRIGLRVGLSDGTNVHMIACLPQSTPSTPYCFGDGSGTACPCGNVGAAGNGCPNSLNASGANLAGSGVASISCDTYLLSGSGMPNSSALYFQGTGTVALGAGVTFGDGLRCAGGVVTRLGTKVNSAGASQYPATGDLSVAVRGLVTAPGTRTYQIWYRNADPSFCTPDTFNLSNGVEVTWVP